MPNQLYGTCLGFDPREGQAFEWPTKTYLESGCIFACVLNVCEALRNILFKEKKSLITNRDRRSGNLDGDFILIILSKPKRRSTLLVSCCAIAGNVECYCATFPVSLNVTRWIIGTTQVYAHTCWHLASCFIRSTNLMASSDVSESVVMPKDSALSALPPSKHLCIDWKCLKIV